jgi:hypothetical protein
MTKAQALKLARAKWGENGTLRDVKNASTKERREAASEELRAHRARKPVKPDSTEPDDYDDYRKRFHEWRQLETSLMVVALSYRYSVGYMTMGGLAFSVQGQGDTWEEACRNAGLLPK